MRPLNETDRHELEEATSEYAEQLVANQEAMDYLLGRGFTPDTISNYRLGFAQTPMPGHEAGYGRIVIPYLTTRGPVKLRFRAMPGQDSTAKYLDLSGGTPRLFGVTSLANDTGGDIVYIAEGECDQMIATQIGLTAVGIPGVQSWRDHFSMLLEGYEKIRILADNDDAGQGAAMGKTIESKMPKHDIKTILMPSGFDVNSAYMDPENGGKDNLLAWINGEYEEDE